MPSFYIGTPATRLPEWAHVASLMFTQKPEPGEGLFYWDVVPGQAIDIGRTKVALKYMACPGKPEFLLMADSDAGWDPATPLRLMSRNLPIVTGMIFKRGLPPVPTCGQFCGKTVTDDYMYDFGPTIKAILKRTDGLVGEDTQNCLTLPEREDDLMEVDGAGCHFMMVRRDVWEKIKQPWFTAVNNGGEDFRFCRKVKEAGFKIYADLSVYTSHIVGESIDFGLREFLAFYKYTDKIKTSDQIWRVEK
jgi:hypothetical protein